MFFSIYRSSESTLASATSTNQSHNNATASVGQNNQLKSNSSNTTTTAPTTSTTNNNNNNNNSNGHGIGGLNNHQRLPFCGLDSIKGSDNNGGDGTIGGGTGGVGIGGLGTAGGKTNLSFDLNLQNGNSLVSSHLGSSSSSTGHQNMPIDNGSEQFHSLDATDSCGDGQFEDDMQALLPKCSRLSRDELSQVSGG